MQLVLLHRMQLAVPLLHAVSSVFHSMQLVESFPAFS